MQMSSMLLNQQQQQHAQSQQPRAATLVVRAPTQIEQVNFILSKRNFFVNLQSEGMQTQHQVANQQQSLVQVGVATSRIGQSLLQENQQQTYVSQQQQVLLPSGGHLIQVQGGQSAVGGCSSYQLQQKVQQQGPQSRPGLLSPVYLQQQGQSQQQQARMSIPSAYKGQQQQSVQLQVQLQPAPQQRPTPAQRASMLRQQPQPQQQYATQLTAQQQQLKVANQQQQIIIQTSNGSQMVAQAQDIGNAQFLDGSQAQKYLSGQLRTVGPSSTTSGPLAAASPRPSYLQPAVNSGGTASIVYHSAPTDMVAQQDKSCNFFVFTFFIVIYILMRMFCSESREFATTAATDLS